MSSMLVRTSADAESKHSSWPPRKLHPVGLLGGTGLVGRMLARSLCEHPFLCCGPIVGSSASAGKRFQDVWRAKEEALEAHYGKELWSPDVSFPSALKGTRVSTLDELLESGCQIVISTIAPRLGFLEDKLVESGCLVVSISPYKRQEGSLCVLEANHETLRAALEKATESALAKVAELGQKVSGEKHPGDKIFPLVKSPNCVCCGTSVVLSGIAAKFGKLKEVSVTTFQSLSGRGDAKYAADLVVGNVYPLNGTGEPTEALIAEELETVLSDSVGSLSVTAYRVSVQRGHLIDVRIKLEDQEAVASLANAEVVYAALESYKPLQKFLENLPSVPECPIICKREGGAPRPKTHFSGGASGGFSVTVGNVKVCDGPHDIALTLVVDNLVKGALGAALQLLEAAILWGPKLD